MAYGEPTGFRKPRYAWRILEYEQGWNWGPTKTYHADSLPEAKKFAKALPGTHPVVIDMPFGGATRPQLIIVRSDEDLPEDLKRHFEHTQELIALTYPKKRKNQPFSKAKLGSGGRFAKCVQEMSKRPDVYDPKGLCAYIGRRKYGAKAMQRMAIRGRKNPRNLDQIAEARRLSEEFHGRPPVWEKDVVEEEKYRDDITILGEMVDLEILVDDEHVVPILFGRGKGETVLLGSTPDGSQLVFIDGNQGIDLESFGIEDEQADKDLVVVGTVHSITYRTDKHHLDDSHGETADYWHVFGEESGVKPILVYDTLNEKLSLAGGNYRVEPEGIVD
jgi:hypothetical protein